MTAMNNERQPESKPMPPHVGVAYKDAIDNINLAKTQQWAITSYALAAYAAIFALGKAEAVSPLERHLLSLLALFVLVSSFSFLALTQSFMTKMRARLTYIYKNYFTEGELCGLKLSIEPKPFWYQPGALLAFWATSLLSFAATVYRIWRG